MALIPCPECNNSVSEKAVSCPKCGCPIYEYKELKYYHSVPEPNNEYERLLEQGWKEVRRYTVEIPGDDWMQGYSIFIIDLRRLTNTD